MMLKNKNFSYVIDEAGDYWYYFSPKANKEELTELVLLVSDLIRQTYKEDEFKFSDKNNHAPLNNQ